MPKNETIIDRLAQQAAVKPDRVIYTFVDERGRDQETLDCGALHAGSQSIARWLLGRAGLQAGDRAILCHPPSLDFVTAVFGCMSAGIVPVPVAPPDPLLGGETLRAFSAIVERSRSRIILTNRSYERARKVGAVRQWFRREDMLWPDVPWYCSETVGEGEPVPELPQPRPDDLAVLQYTSGSTSDPKGVLITHANVMHQLSVNREDLGLGEESRALIWVPHFHDFGLISGIFSAAYGNGSLHMMSPLTFLRDPSVWPATMARIGATHTAAPDFAYRLTVRKTKPEQRRSWDLSRLKVAMSAAEPVRPSTVDGFVEAFKVSGFDAASFCPAYGLAEHTVGVSIFGRSRIRIDRGKLEHERRVVVADPECPGTLVLMGCGPVCEGVDVRIVNPDTMCECGPDEAGEIWVDSPSKAKGYDGEESLTQDVFEARLNGNAGAGPFLRTGDLGFLLGGELFVSGRLKDMIALRGRNVFPQDLEKTAQEAHELVRPGRVVAFSVPPVGEGREEVEEDEVAVLVEVREKRLSESELIEVIRSLRSRLQEAHQLSVQAVILGRRGSVLKTTSGKLRRGAHRAAYTEGALQASALLVDLLPVRKAGQEEEAYRAASGFAGGTPRSAADIQDWLVHWMSRVLNVSSEEIRADEPFARYGIDSVNAIELVQALEAWLPDAPPLGTTTAWRYPTIEKLAQYLSESLESSKAPGGSPVADRIVNRPEGSTAPLSAGQKRIWVLDRLAPGIPLYTIHFALRLSGPLDREALAGSLSELIERHDSLRTVFPETDGKPRAMPIPARSLELPIVDLYSNGGSPEARASEVERLLRENAERPFNLLRGPLYRMALVAVDEQEHVLIAALHHIVSDMWSNGILLSELAELYRARITGKQKRLPELSVTYADYAHWQQERRRTDEYAQTLRWWTGRLNGLPPLILPFVRHLPGRPSHAGDVVSFVLSPEQTEALKALAGKEGYTPFLVLLSAWAVLLFRYSKQKDFGIATLGFGRDRPELKDVVGFFVNTLVLRCELGRGLSFAELLGRMHGVLEEALARQEVDFREVALRVRNQVRQGLNPLVQTSFALQNAPFPTALDVPDMDWSVEQASLDGGVDGVAKFDLGLVMMERDGLLHGSIEYSTDQFEAASIDRMTGHFQELLAGIVAHPDQSIASLPMLTAHEREQLLVGFNPSEKHDPAAGCIHDLFEQQAARTPEATALVFEGQTTTYAELNAQASRLAQHLRGLGIGPEVLVGLCMERSTEMVVGLLAILKAGAAYVPFDPAYPARRIAFMVEDAGATVLLTQERLLPSLPETSAAIICLDRDASMWAEAPATPPVSSAGPRNLAYVLYTSGSTGVPKGVAIEHRNAVTLLNWARTVYSPEDLAGVLASTSICFDLSVFELFVPLSWGGAVYLVQNLLQLPESPFKNRVSLINTVPSVMAGLLQVSDLPSGIRAVNLAGEPLSQALVKQILRLNGGIRVHDLYGPTEDTTYTTFVRRYEDSPATIGRPIDNKRAYVLDSSLNPVPIGIPGELYIAGAGLARGYLGRPSMTAERFVPDPFSSEPEARMYRTGDRVRWTQNGHLEYLGRLDHQVKVRGFRIELGEIEAVLSQHPGVREAVVLVNAAEGGRRRLIGYVVAEEEPVPGTAELRAHLKQFLPDHMVPLNFVQLRKLPLTPNGKVDRRALQTLDTPDDQTVCITSENPTELELVEIWRSILGTESFGIDDRFYETGGDSLSLVEMTARARRAFGVDLPLRVAVERQTVRELAKAIDELSGDASRTNAPAEQGSGQLTEPLLKPPDSGAAMAETPRWAGLFLQGHRALIRMLASVEIDGVENIPRSGPLIIASNHVNWLDFPVMVGMTGDAFGHLPGRLGFAAAHRWKKLFHFYFKLIGEPVYFRKGQGELSELQRLTAILKAGGMVAVAPEGTFNRGSLIRAKMGVVRLAVEGAAPVLPIAIHGQHGVLGQWSRLRRLQVKIRIGPVITLASNAVNQAARQREADRVMEALAELLPADYRGDYAYIEGPGGDT